MTPRTVTIAPIPRGRAAQLSIGMWSLAISDDELALLIAEATVAARVLGVGPVLRPGDSAGDII